MRVVRVDEDVWQALQKKAKPFEDTPNTVLRRVLKLNGTHPVKKKKPLPPGKMTPSASFRVPIAKVLYEQGGASKVKDGLACIGQMFAGKFTEADLELVASGEVRWRNAAQWERLAMVKDGLLKKNSPRGVWELTEKGVKFAEQHLR